MRYLISFLIGLFVLTGLNGCGSSVPMLKPYKLDIQQGNLVTSKMLLQLKPGMTKSQVRYIMGTPLIVDSFHKDRWDYFYQMRQGGKITEQRRVILTFEQDLLKNVRGDVVPQGSAQAGTDDVKTGAKTTAELQREKQEDRGILERFKFWGKDETAAEAAVAAPKAAASAAEPAKAAEKSLLDKLKFWKKDETPVTKPVEAPKEMLPSTNAAAAPVAEAPAAEAPADTPSILAVPEGVEVFTAPAKEAEPEPAAPQAVKLEPTPEPIKQEPVMVAPAPAQEPAPVKPAAAPVAAPDAAKVEPPKPAPAVPSKPQPAPTKAAQPAMANKKRDEKMIFRLDRTLKQELLEQELAPAVAPAPTPEPVADKPAEKVAKPKKKAEEEPLPAESEPGFFDRMLEKIGF